MIEIFYDVTFVYYDTFISVKNNIWKISLNQNKWAEKWRS